MRDVREGALAVGDLPPDQFRRRMHEVADMVADYLTKVERYPVLPPIEPGAVRSRLPAAPPEQPEPLDAILADYRRLIEPNITHWNHPGFFAYFAITGSGPGILGETLAAALNVNAMIWKSGPAPTELEEHVCDWVRQLIGLPDGWRGHINDTASMSTLLALAAARHRTQGGLARSKGVRALPPLTVYASEHAHTAVDKAVITLGLGEDHLRRLPTDDEFRFRVDALEEAIASDRRAGRLPMAVLATVGTTSSTSVDPVAELAAVARREDLWLHVDAAYAGPAAICPEYRAVMPGLELADSLVLNPHKWLFTPMDCSVLLLRDADALRSAFALAPDILKTYDARALNLMDYGPQLGRRFRALKLWFVLRAFGAEGIRARIRAHCEWARAFAAWVAGTPGFEVCAPVPFSTVCFRATPAAGPEDQDAFNERLLAAVNAAGPVFLSSTRLRGRLVLRLAIGNLRTTEAHVRRAFEIVREARDHLGRVA